MNRNNDNYDDDNNNKSNNFISVQNRVKSLLNSKGERELEKKLSMCVGRDKFNNDKCTLYGWKSIC